MPEGDALHRAARRLQVLVGEEVEDGLWDFRIFVHVELEEAMRRGVARDGPQTERLYRRRYGPGQRLYLESVQPADRADALVDNTDPERLSLVRDAGRRS